MPLGSLTRSHLTLISTIILTPHYHILTSPLSHPHLSTITPSPSHYHTLTSPLLHPHLSTITSSLPTITSSPLHYHILTSPLSHPHLSTITPSPLHYHTLTFPLSQCYRCYRTKGPRDSHGSPEQKRVPQSSGFSQAPVSIERSLAQDTPCHQTTPCRAGSSMYHAIGYGSIIFLQAVFSMEPVCLPILPSLTVHHHTLTLTPSPSHPHPHTLTLTPLHSYSVISMSSHPPLTLVAVLLNICAMLSYRKI